MVVSVSEAIAVCFICHLRLREATKEVMFSVSQFFSQLHYYNFMLLNLVNFS